MRRNLHGWGGSVAIHALIAAMPYVSTTLLAINDIRSSRVSDVIRNETQLCAASPPTIRYWMGGDTRWTYFVTSTLSAVLYAPVSASVWPTKTRRTMRDSRIM